ncbi:F0F1 ATP synthase subunit gamma [Arenicella xantha]|uniref:ATP synthase gamma chain n=1 Tax=Arenicella xantha TaxID=644221 RepID=A0A395JQA1_9GAMM|nr:F0F1 ATP synthase subunit gamma [Arenicella xantha]RBP53789.1 ATP synthase F1 subcomplex gamma subunit [Arenicella xantha]
MAVGKEIRDQITSVKSTQKITKAMEMVAASKMRRAQDRMLAARPYAQKIRSVVAHISKANLEYKHPFTVARDIKRVGYIVVSSDRGLCGGLNMNVFRKTMTEMADWDSQGVEIDIATIGSKALAYFRRTGGNVVSEASNYGDKPNLDDLLGAILSMLTAYEEGRIDRLYVVSNDFVNTMTQSPTSLQLLPVVADKEASAEVPALFDYIYEPEAKPILDVVLKRYVESQIYQAVVENVACEQSARMVAMKSASDNAGDLIGELQLVYNKARQAAITQEISEIVSGAAAV